MMKGSMGPDGALHGAGDGVDGRCAAHGALQPGVAPAARHYLPGGREHGGGIGRMVGYIVDAAAALGERHLVTDTRGPSWSPLRSTPRLLGALFGMALDRVLAPWLVHHIHVAGRGSTVRKLALAAMARWLGCAHVLHLHDYDYASDLQRRPRWQRALVRDMFRGAARVIVLGSGDKALMTDKLGVDASRVVVLRNAVPDPGAPRARDASAPPRIVFLGRLSARKGVPELLEALASPEMRALGWRATLAGDGPVEHYRREAERLGIGDRVDMPGWLDAPGAAALCADSDILALPSHNEGLAMAVLEGMAHGLAVVTTPVGAQGEALADGVLMTPPADAAALAEALARMTRDAPARARQGAAGRALYCARFDIGRYAAALAAVHHDARGGRPVGRRLEATC